MKNNITNNRFIKGTTLVEMMMVLACFSVVAFGTYQIIVLSQTSNALMNAWNSLTQWGQNAIDEINIELTQARIIFQNDALGQAYLAKLQSDSNYPVLSTTTLPAIDSTGTFHQDTTVSRTGNGLLFVKESPPFISDAGGTGRRTDICIFIYCYLSPITRSIGTMPLSLRLTEWTSIEFADYNQVTSITGTARTTFVTNLYVNRGIRCLWIPRNVPNNAFYHIYANGNIDATPDANYIIQKNTIRSVIQDLGVAGYTSVAWNTSNQFHTPDVVPKYAEGNSVGAGFPHGFEIQIIGPTSARQTMVRLVLAYFITVNNSLFSNESLTMVTTREY
jgi:hypothetical protein